MTAPFERDMEPKSPGQRQEESFFDSTVQSFLSGRQRQGLLSPHAEPPSKARQSLEAIQSTPPAYPGASIQVIEVDGGTLGRVPVHIFRPVDVQTPLPIIVYFHGGAWVMGDAASYGRLAKELSVGVQAAVVFVDFGLAPETLYTSQVEQAYNVLQYLIGATEGLNLDETRIAVAGDCSGGSLATAVCLLAKSRRGAEISLQLLLYPVVAEPNGSLSNDIDEVWMTRDDLKQRIEEVFPAPDQRQTSLAFPLQAPLWELNDLPETLILVAEHDIARDDGERFARRLNQAGVSVTCTRYNGVIHDFLLLNALADSPPSRSALLQVTAALKAALHP